MILLGAVRIELKATGRLLGPWLPVACVLWCTATWLQEPLFLRGYGIDLLWDGGQAVALLALAASGLAWCVGRSQTRDWAALIRRSPWVATISGGIGLLAYGVALCILVIACMFSLDRISSQPVAWGRLPEWLSEWAVRGIPLAFLAPGIASLRMTALSTSLLWCAAAALCLGAAVTLPETWLAAAIAGAGSILVSAGLIRSPF